MQVYWSQDFQIKTFVPRFDDDSGLVSPQTADALSSVKLSLPDRTKHVRLKSLDFLGCTLKIFKGDSEITAENGSTLLTGTSFEFPCEDITAIEISNPNSTNIAVYFEFFLLPVDV